MKMINQLISKVLEREVICLNSTQNSTKNALVSYITSPFIKSHKNVFHSNVYECRIIVECLLGMGYNVDIINWDNDKFVPRKKYAVFIDIHNNIDRLHSLLDQSTIKILYVTGAHWLYQNHSEYSRLIDIQTRKQTSLVPRRISPPCRSIESANCAIVLGRKTAYESFQYANKPLYPIDLLSITLYDWLDNKDFKKARKNFLWLGGRGLVHKGLDLVLEVFKDLPKINLYVCADVKAEPDFESLYFSELYKTQNIHYLGWTNIYDKSFNKILSNCGTIVYPSCSEAQSPSVITCMHGGLIPIISRQCGLEIDEFGIELKKCSYDEIKSSVMDISEIEPKSFEKMAKKSWEYSRKKHTIENYRTQMSETLTKIIKL